MYVECTGSAATEAQGSRSLKGIQHVGQLLACRENQASVEGVSLQRVISSALGVAGGGSTGALGGLAHPLGPHD